MKKLLILLIATLLLTGCSTADPSCNIAATTLPVYEFSLRLCEGTPLRVSRLVTEQVSCLHDYSLNVQQVKTAQAAEVVVLSGAGLEEFMEDILVGVHSIDASTGIDLICPESEHEHGHEHENHHHESDPHIWLSPVCAKIMVQNICNGLSARYPEYTDTFQKNLMALHQELDELLTFGKTALSQLSCTELITFHDGFSYFAQAFDLSILEAVEEESGSEASAKELIHLIEEVTHHQLPAVFTERSGSDSAASIISKETGCRIFTLDMAMAGDSYFEAMYHNIHTVKEALQ